MSLIVTKNGTDNINPKYKSLKIQKQIGSKGLSLTFTTTDEISELDEIEVVNNSVTIFAGIIEKVVIQSNNGIIEKTVSSTGYKRLFDRKKIAYRYEGMTAGAIVQDIIGTWTEGFTEGTIESGVTLETVVFNYKKPSDAISQIANSIGFIWKIDNEKAVHFYAKNTDTAPLEITDSSSNYFNLNITPDISELANSIIIRGGAYLSTEQSYKEVGDGQKTVFYLPENPRDVTVKVNGSTKTLGIKFGETTPTTEFIVNYNEKYIENGTYATLTSSDTIEVLFKYDVPIRIRKRDLSSIAEMAAIFPDTDGVFEKVINNVNIDSRELALQMADEYLEAYSNATITGSFQCYNDSFEPGQIITINAKGINKQAVIDKVSLQSIANGFCIYTVSFATVLFDFEDFCRMLLSRTEIDINDSETVENIYNIFDAISVSETTSATIDENRQIDSINITESNYQELNASIQYVLGPYFPSSHTDNKRVFILDGSPLA